MQTTTVMGNGVVESPFARYKRICEVRKDCRTSLNTFFIKNHVSSTEIKVVRTQNNLDAVLVFDEDEGADNTYVYTYLDADVKEGDYFEWNSKRFIVLELINIVNEIGFRKWSAIECNVMVDSTYYAAYLGNVRSHKRLRGTKFYEESGLTPVLVAPQGTFAIGANIKMGAYTWKIIDADDLSLPAIAFYSLERGLSAVAVSSPDAETILFAGQLHTINADNGQIAAIPNVEVVQRTGTNITIRVPLGIASLSLSGTYQDTPFTKTYTVKGG